MRINPILFLVVLVICTATGILTLCAGNTSVGAACLTVCAIDLWVLAQELRWPERMRLAVMRFKLHHLNRAIAEAKDDSAQAYHDDPGGSEWRALDEWLLGLIIERRALRQRIEDAIYKLDQTAY